jgi:hypothetical protein
VCVCVCVCVCIILEGKQEGSRRQEPYTATQAMT